MPAPITCEIADDVAFVTLNRPEKRNALSLEALTGLIDTGRRLRGDRSVRAVLLAGNGPAFCAGIDTSVLAGGRGEFLRSFLPRPVRGTNVFQEAVWTWRRLPVPVVAAVHGHCFGAGLQLALAADFRFSTPDAGWSIMESKWGLVPDMAGVHALSQQVGIDVAKRLTMTGEIVSGERAYRLGLVTEVADDPRAAAGALIDQILLRSPDAIAAAKRLFESSWHRGPRATLARERWAQWPLLTAANTRIARKVAIEKAAPEYRPRGGAGLARR